MQLISPHIKFEKLADLAEGRAAASERDTLAAHISTCKRCSERLSRLQSTIEIMREDTAEDAPSYVLAKASELLRTRIKPAPSVFKQVLASLKFDSLHASPAFAVRSGATSERQLLFSASGNDLHLQIKRAEEQWIISGQVLGPCAGGNVELQGSTVTAKALLSDLCEFTLEPVPEGTYVLTVQLPDAQLKVPELQVGLS
jgi:anti-sigma factor RsiW